MIEKEFFIHIDRNGIDGEWRSGVFTSLDSNYDEKLPSTSIIDDYFVPFMFQFNLSIEEKIELIKEYFKKTFSIHLDNLNEINNLNVLFGNLFLVPVNNNNRLTYTIVKPFFEFDLYLRDVFGVKNLGIIESIKGGLFLSNTSIESLYPLKYLYGDFWMSGSTNQFLKDIGCLEVVKGTLNLSRAKLKDLGALRIVGGNLNLRSTNIIDLSLVEEIGGNLLLNKHNKDLYILNTDVVKGKIKYYNN